MKWKNFLQIFSIALAITLFAGCKGPMGNHDFFNEVDEDSDRPEWAGGNTDANEHNNKPNPGTMGGTKDYGDMVVLLRDDDGVPEMLEFDELDEEGNVIGTFWVYQPLDINGETLDLDQYGEVVNPLAVVEVDFGRLNIVRSPESVLNQALNEVLTAMNGAVKFSQDFCGRLSIWKYVEVLNDEGNTIEVLQVTKTIDSPRENMAIYREIMRNQGSWGQLSALGGSGINAMDLAAACFAGGSDKTGTVDVDEVEYVNGMMKIPGTLYDAVGKEYFSFGYNYNRETTFAYRYLQFFDYINGEYFPNGEPVSVLDAMEDRELFRYRYDGEKSNVDGFACAVDDAVQVLEFVHGNSNIAFVPDYVP